MSVCCPRQELNSLESMNTPADYYDANWSYDLSAYHKGAIFLNQLKYIVGERFVLEWNEKILFRWMI